MNTNTPQYTLSTTTKGSVGYTTLRELKKTQAEVSVLKTILNTLAKDHGVHLMTQDENTLREMLKEKKDDLHCLESIAERDAINANK